MPSDKISPVGEDPEMVLLLLTEVGAGPCTDEEEGDEEGIAGAAVLALSTMNGLLSW